MGQINRKIIILALIVLLILIPTVSAENVTIGTSTSIKDLVDASDAGDTITLLSGTYKESGIEINKNLTIQGSGDAGSVVINGEYSDSIVRISSPCTVTFRNMTFTSGFSKNGGAAIDAKGGCGVILQNCIFKSNICGANGGAVNIEGDSETWTYSTLMMDNCRFVSNIAGENGGAVNTFLTETKATRCEFIKNYAGSDGGAMASGEASKTKLISCDIEDNVGENGGAVFNRLGNVFLTSSEIINNTARHNGGAFYSTGPLISLGLKIMDNKARRAGIIYVSNESESIEPGAIFEDNKMHANTAKDGTIAYFEEMMPNYSNFNYNYWGDVNPNSTNWDESFVRNYVFESPEIWYPLEVRTIILHSETKESGEYIFSATFLTNAGKPLKNSDVIFRVNSERLVAKTDNDGMAKVKIQLEPGNYTITAVNLQTGEELSFDFEVPQPTKNQHTNTTVFMRDGKAVGAFSYTVNLHGLKTTIDTGEGIITKAITFNKGGITVSTKTNDTVVKDRITTMQIAQFFVIFILLLVVLYGSYRYRKSR